MKNNNLLFTQTMNTNQIKIKIAGKEYILKQSFRGLMTFEEMTNKPVEAVETMKDILTLFYCLLKACNKETFTYSLDSFIDELDDSGAGIETFTNFMKGANQGTNEKKKTGRQS
jgi:hypothetical protein